MTSSSFSQFLFTRLLPFLYLPLFLLSPSVVIVSLGTGLWRPGLETATGTEPILVVIFFILELRCCCRVKWPPGCCYSWPPHVVVTPYTSSHHFQRVLFWCFQHLDHCCLTGLESPVCH